MSVNESHKITTVKINRSYANLHLAASKLVGRKILHNVYIDAEDKKAIASDGRMMAIASIDINGSESFSIPPEAFKDNLSKMLKRDKVATIKKNGAISVQTQKSRSIYEAVDSNYPQWKQVIPRESKNGYITVTFSPKLLLTLAKSLDLHNVALHINSDDHRQPLIITSVDSSLSKGEIPESMGVLMPVRDNKNSQKK